ncbi:MAG TPA: hypothetical protein VIH99_13625 [Bdellovibrionota bacterium]|jgi:hypothetical protein
MKPESLPPVKSIYLALEDAAVDVYGFAVICHGGAAWLAEPEVLESLLLSLENFWFVEDESGRLSHQEFREEVFRAIWEKSRDKQKAQPVRIGTDVPLGHEEMAFYKLPQLTRAALYLRTKKRFAYASIALVLGSAESNVRAEVERAREFLLGRRLKPMEWSEDDF